MFVFSFALLLKKREREWICVGREVWINIWTYTYKHMCMCANHKFRSSYCLNFHNTNFLPEMFQFSYVITVHNLKLIYGGIDIWCSLTNCYCPQISLLAWLNLLSSDEIPRYSKVDNYSSKLFKHYMWKHTTVFKEKCFVFKFFFEGFTILLRKKMCDTMEDFCIQDSES